MPHLSTYIGLADHSEKTLAESLRAVAGGHAAEADVFHTCQMLAQWSEEHRHRLAPVIERYGADDDVTEPERLHADGLAEVRSGPVGLLRDLQDLHVLASLVQTTWTVVAQGAQGLRDIELLQVARASNAETSRQLTWLNTRMKAAAPQALMVDT
ncbi:hypothetical protein ASE01_20540 [Nocardioides sp. Root190]|uniref:hypothetical protein n=1 Tax=Nocardioides sp. Root190 TaxID=1736488 RepID=UPI0006FE7B24|nr:hypothetical protein [Nocardioides sp. Root190]KRB73156.1 hypothetical protein ASE01_20540 [Nocardioides sp. Root190]